MSQYYYYDQGTTTCSNTFFMFLNEDANYTDILPTYCESKRSPRCEEDISNPAPSYEPPKRVTIQSGADKLAEWLTFETRRIFRH